MNMTRRIALETAEIVDIVIQTRAAFGLDYALRYVQLSGIHNELLYKILATDASTTPSRFSRFFDKWRTASSSKKDKQAPQPVNAGFGAACPSSEAYLRLSVLVGLNIGPEDASAGLLARATTYKQ